MSQTVVNTKRSLRPRLCNLKISQHAGVLGIQLAADGLFLQHVSRLFFICHLQRVLRIAAPIPRIAKNTLLLQLAAECAFDVTRSQISCEDYTCIRLATNWLICAKEIIRTQWTRVCCTFFSANAKKSRDTMTENASRSYLRT